MSIQTIRLFEPYWNHEEKAAVMEVLDGDYLSENKKTRELEQKFAEFVNARFCVVVPSGAIALYMSLKATHDWNRKSMEVPSYAGIFVAQACRKAGLTVNIEDVNIKTAVVDDSYYHPNIFTVHANGRRSVFSIVEDCCQAIDYHSTNSVSSYSFHPTKHMTLGGIGGAVCCDDRSIYEKLQEIKDHGRTIQSKKLDGDSYPSWGCNYKVSEINSAFGLVQLKRLPERLRRLREVTRMYKEILGDRVGYLDGEPSWYPDILVYKQKENTNGITVYAPYGQSPENKAYKVVEKMKALGTELRQFYKPITAHFGQYNDYAAMALHVNGVYLPCSYSLTDEQVHIVCDNLISVLKA